ncbi:monocarboxylate transporter [Scheffersomyces coipomensis]|uniref:monocarboxylate transporter n=1 Tax=Scheffersomyces coipomensis TaxID=1788519 RepID=UPI00315CC9AB
MSNKYSNSDIESHDDTNNSIAAFPLHHGTDDEGAISHVNPIHRESSLAEDIDENESLFRVKTNQTELSRIISGIRDDLQLHEGETDAKSYAERAYPESILVNQLDMISRHSTKNDLSLSASHDKAKANEDDDEYDDDDDGLSDDFKPETVRPEDEVVEGEHPIDGWFSILMSLCTMFLIVSCWGVNSAYGVFLDFYLSSGQFPGATQYDFALIGGLVVFLAQFLAPVSIIAFKIFGFKRVALFGVTIQTIAYILASFATKIWHLFLTQGVLVGISFAFVFLPATLVLPTWVKKRRATSMGIAVSGAGLGGVIFSLSVNSLIEKTGDQRWALRMCGIVTFVITMFATLIMRPRKLKNPPKLKDTLTKQNFYISVKAVFDIKVFKNYALIVLAFWFAIALLGYMLLLFSIAAYATSIGLKSSQGSALTSILNAAQVVGRPCMGIVGDKIGRTNLASGMSFSIAILLFAFWINATTYPTLIGFSVLIGLVVGIGSSMAQPIATDILEDTPYRLPAAWAGMNIFVSFFCLIAEVISLSLTNDNSTRPFLNSQIFAGCCFVGCGFLMLTVREWLVRDKLKKRLNISQGQIKKLKSSISKKSTNYLTTSDLQPLQSSEKTNPELIQELQILEERIERYNRLLSPTPISFILRLFYPIKV